MTGRLIVLSNRIPTGGPPSGGLVVAIHELLAERGGLWIGSGDDFAETPSESFQPVEGGKGYDKAIFDLTEAEYNEFYLGYANSVLWPLCHHRTDLIALDRQYAEGYARVNARVARMLAQIVEPEDVIWVHDYHFLPLALELRKLGVTARIGLFLHIPFPTLPDIEALPERDDFYYWLAAFDLVGLQTEADVARCLDSYRARPSGEMLFNGRVKFDDRAFEVRSFPIGIDGKTFTETAQKPITHNPVYIRANAKLILGVDRLDYSKGIPHRVRGFGTWLENRSPESPRATFIQITPPSRETVPAYQAIKRELEALVGQINGRYGELDWTPIRLIERGVPRDTLAPLYRLADIALVTPLADGMNLVAKEFVAAQDPEDPGVLILSRSAGAAEQMTEALIVNPHDAEEVGDAIERAFMMPREERQARHAALLQVVRDTDIFDWGTSFLDRLNRVERKSPPAASSGET
ncbi:trehalose 6-phosphate synthase [Palleronia marisminoris]|uniref:Alpha,alpha-trehalose-phosphate synthase [UDP-forming] n=1 Tax=Palleronia marisminoris TaxID=315423 RepID=A0A1Y5STG7_9RHOB|nr:trehalose-6-phosphate synthase [Palleronia marisminoris]SFG94198.1 trehalose 6-phosphate synthase [Palleronia marisminoris]SLN46129.1 Alpha,alpha-trehalose-phosphate synthase [UDP-forming] [Palleronia marisminoris]